jgi:CheY-like chemotaxis protein
MPGQILVVEDDLLTRKQISEFLREESYEVHEAGDGTDAVKLLENRHFDLMITDFSMPQLDGVRLVERIHRKSPNTPVIFVSGYITIDSAKALLPGMAEILSKPIRLEELLATIKRLLEEAR